MKKTFVLDTNVLIHEPEAILSFQENEVVIPLQVIEELDVLKKGHGEIPYSARQALKLIDSYREKGDISKGLPLQDGGILKTQINGKKNYLQEKTPDNRIISVAVDIKKKKNGNGDGVILVSKDTAVRIKAESLGVAAQDYKKDKTNVFQKYGRLINDAENYSNGILSTRYKKEGELIFQIYGADLMKKIRRQRNVWGILPKNCEQECAMDALTDPRIEVVALTGNAGTGKTLLALASGFSQTIRSDSLYKQVIVSRPVVPMGGRSNDLGFLPGDINEKLDPWMQPIFDNIDVIINEADAPDNDKSGGLGYKNKQYIIEKGYLQIESLSHIRGRSLPKKYFIIDEAQNLRPLDVKTIITRGGNGTKIIFTGDLGQIDTPYLDAESNGLAYLISRYINEPEFCYLNLVQGARSLMAEKAAQLL